MKGHKDGYERTAASRESLAGFRRTLPRQGSALRVCPPGCPENHDAGKVPGKDHWEPRKARKRKAKR